MTIRSLRLLTALVAVAASATAFGRDDDAHGRDRHDRHDRHDRPERAQPAMAAVPNAALPGDPGHGWRYFSDAAGRRAVVISPEGTYYLSLGKGLRPVAETRRAT